MADNRDKRVLKSSIEREQNQTCLNSAEREKIKGSTNLNVPHLRFPEFTEGWEEVTLKEVADFQKDRVSTELLNESTYISTENIQQNFGGIQLANTVPTNANVIAYNKNDILLSNIRPYLKKVWLADRNGGCSADVFVLRSRCCEQSFLYNVIASDRFIGYVMSGAKGVKMPRGDKKQMENFKFSLPSVIEQRKISRLLSLLDERIATQNKIIEKLESLIKGIAHMVAGMGKPNVCLKECLECTSSTLQESEVSDLGTYPVYGANGIVGYLDSYNTSDEAIYIVKDGSGVGSVAYVKGKCSATGTLNILTAKQNYSLQFLYYLLKVFNYSPYKTGMAIPHIYFKDYGKSKTFCPPYAEQLQYAQLLVAIDTKLLAEKKILFSFNSQKQYLLRELFI